jgi:hypothetical protein
MKGFVSIQLISEDVGLAQRRRPCLRAPNLILRPPGLQWAPEARSSARVTGRVRGLRPRLLQQ